MRQKAFTLVEILIVVTIMGLMAGVAIPRLSFYFEPPSAVLQRAIENACDKALSGTPIRISIKPEGTSQRGYMFAEALMQREIEENSLSAFLGTNSSRSVVLEWQEIKLRDLPENSGWRFEPEIIYFYSDGSCSPAKISYADPKASSTRDTEEYILTVTGYCTKLEKRN